MDSLFQVLRLKMNGGELIHMEEVFADSGRHLSHSCVAAYRNGSVLIGTVSGKAMFCQVAYLQWHLWTKLSMTECDKDWRNLEHNG